MSKIQNEIAATWWADVLKPGTKQDNGEDFGPIESMLVTVCALKFQPTPEQIEVFKNELKTILDSDESIDILSTDYACGVGLRKAAEVAGISSSCPPFPMKTVMWVNADRVSVSYGYGAKAKFLWVKDKLFKFVFLDKYTGKEFYTRSAGPDEKTALSKVWSGSEEYHTFVSSKEITLEEQYDS